MAKRLYYRDSYGRWQRDRQAERGSGGGTPAKFAVITLVVITAIMVLASLLQSFYHALLHAHG
jgi:hypothetical protein